MKTYFLSIILTVSLLACSDVSTDNQVDTTKSPEQVALDFVFEKLILQEKLKQDTIYKIFSQDEWFLVSLFEKDASFYASAQICYVSESELSFLWTDNPTTASEQELNLSKELWAQTSNTQVSEQDRFVVPEKVSRLSWDGFAKLGTVNSYYLSLGKHLRAGGQYFVECKIIQITSGDINGIGVEVRLDSAKQVESWAASVFTVPDWALFYEGNCW